MQAQAKLLPKHLHKRAGNPAHALAHSVECGIYTAISLTLACPLSLHLPPPLPLQILLALAFLPFPFSPGKRSPEHTHTKDRKNRRECHQDAKDDRKLPGTTTKHVSGATVCQPLLHNNARHNLDACFRSFACMHLTHMQIWRELKRNVCFQYWPPALRRLQGSSEPP